MAERQVISFHATGIVSGLQRKPGEGLDLRSLGTADIRRASEVLWDQTTQKWYVKITLGKYKGIVITNRMREAASTHTILANIDTYTAHALFTEYDDAVSAEIAVLDHIRCTEGHSALE